MNTNAVGTKLYNPDFSNFRNFSEEFFSYTKSDLDLTVLSEVISTFSENNEVNEEILREVAVKVPSFDIMTSLETMKSESGIFQQIVTDYAQGNPDISDEDAFRMAFSISKINESTIENVGIAAALDDLNIQDVSITNFIHEVVDDSKFVSVMG